MRLSPLSLVVAVVALALVPVAYGSQDLRSPDARDANAAVHAQTLQDLAKERELRVPQDNWRFPLLTQEKYYGSYGKAAQVPSRATHDSSPLPAIGIGIGLIVLVAGMVAVAVHTRRRTVRLAV